jgi:biuret amidohydrolase
MTQVQMVDRSSMIAALNDELEIRPRDAAIVTIDMHRGHLDMSVATMPTNPDDAARVIANARGILDHARSLGIPVIHVKLVMRRLHNGGSETSIVPFWQALHKIGDERDRLTPGRKSTVNAQNVEGSPGCDIIAEIYD